MKYKLVIVLTPHLTRDPQDGEDPFIVRNIDTTVEAGGYFITDPTGSFLELSEKKGVVEVFPLVHVVQFVAEELDE